MRLSGWRVALAASLLLSSAEYIAAADVAFTAAVDKNRVGVGERLTLSFNLENAGMGGGEDLKLPDLSDFYILSGPNKSSSVQFINGKVSSSVTYTYILQPKGEGTFTIGSASVDVDDRTYSSQPVHVEVVKGQQARQNPQQPQSTPSEVDDEIAGNLYLKAIVDTDHVVQGEQVNLTYRIYTRVNVSDYALQKVPAYTGFWTEEIQAEGDSPVSTDVIDGREFRVGTIRQIALFPTRSGELEISPLEVQTAIQVRRSRRRDPFDSFFNDPFDSFFKDPFGRTVQYMLRSNPLTIHVDPLPGGAPGDFNGAVGTFDMEVSLDKSASKINDPINLRVSLKGRGNIKLLEAPEFAIPPGLENYPPKVTEKIQRAGGAISGTKTFEYLMIPRSPGRFRIDPFSFSFFDPSGRRYVTLRSQALDIAIETADQEASTSQGGLPRTDVEFLTQDIRFINLTDLDLVRRGEFLFVQPHFIALVVMSFVTFLGALAVGRKFQRTRGDVLLYRQRRAMKKARKRLRLASDAMREGPETFYPQISHAVWGYLGDRLNIDPGEFSFERVSGDLSARGVPIERVNALREILETCSMANYAPGSSGTSAMGEFFERAKELLSDLEKALR